MKEKKAKTWASKTQKERKQNPKEAEIMISKESVQLKTVVFR